MEAAYSVKPVSNRHLCARSRAEMVGASGAEMMSVWSFEHRAVDLLDPVFNPEPSRSRVEVGVALYGISHQK